MSDYTYSLNDVEWAWDWYKGIYFMHFTVKETFKQGDSVKITDGKGIQFPSDIMPCSSYLGGTYTSVTGAPFNNFGTMEDEFLIWEGGSGDPLVFKTAFKKRAWASDDAVFAGQISPLNRTITGLIGLFPYAIITDNSKNDFAVSVNVIPTFNSRDYLSNYGTPPYIDVVKGGKHTFGTVAATGFLFEGDFSSSQNAPLIPIKNISSQSQEYDPDDPYNKKENSEDDGGGGDNSHDSDDDDVPDLPTTGVADSGFVTLYAPTEAQLKALAKYLWSDAFSLDSFKKMFNDPMDCILGLSLLPVNLPHGSAQEITVGNLVTTVSCDTCKSQFLSVKCGSVTILPSTFSNSYLCYSPYTKTSLYLPFIGTQPLDTDEVMGSTITVEYHIDVLTGAMCAYVLVDHKSKPNDGHHHVLYTYMGQCSESVPLSSQSWGDSIGSILNAAAQIGGVVATAATGGAAAPVAAIQLASASTATANACQSMKPTVNHSGSLGGGGGMMAQRKPKLIFSMPNISKPASQQTYTGYPTNRTLSLSECSGFTQVQSVNVKVSGNGVGATQAELDEIERLLKEGVYI